MSLSVSSDYPSPRSSNLPISLFQPIDRYPFAVCHSLAALFPVVDNYNPNLDHTPRSEGWASTVIILHYNFLPKSAVVRFTVWGRLFYLKPGIIRQTRFCNGGTRTWTKRFLGGPSLNARVRFWLTWCYLSVNAKTVLKMCLFYQKTYHVTSSSSSGVYPSVPLRKYSVLSTLSHRITRRHFVRCNLILFLICCNVNFSHRLPLSYWNQT